MPQKKILGPGTERSSASVLTSSSKLKRLLCKKLDNEKINSNVMEKCLDLWMK